MNAGCIDGGALSLVQHFARIAGGLGKMIALDRRVSLLAVPALLLDCMRYYINDISAQTC